MICAIALLCGSTTDTGLLTKVNRFIFFLAIFAAGCASEKNDHGQVKVFLTEWSAAITSKDQSLRRFYDARFTFPKVFFEQADGLKYQFDIPNTLISSTGNENEISAKVPFSIANADGTDSEESSILLTIAKNGHSFLIRDMTQELAVKIKEYSLRVMLSNQAPEQVLAYDSILGGVLTSVSTLSQHYDSVVFFTDVNDVRLFYVVNGQWQDPYGYQVQRDSGNYQMGVVTAENKVVIPVEYDKIYNPNGSFDGMIEVEKNGKRGLFRISGELFLSADYEGIYPANLTGGVFAQVRRGEKYGWVDNTGRVFLDPSSHSDKKLFQSPIENNMILKWEFKYPGSIALLIEPHQDVAEANGIIVYPSYLRDVGITGIANDLVMLETSEFGMGMTDNVIRFEEVETLSDRLFGLVSFFMESGADARYYHTARHDLIVVDKNMDRIDYLEGLTKDQNLQNPCGRGDYRYKTIQAGLYESSDGYGAYKYYKVATDGTIEQLESVRQFDFTKFAMIDEHYFERCVYENIEYDGGWDGSKPNIIVASGLSMDDLDIMRNEIFAEYGYKFKSDKWKRYFESKSWYRPQHDNVDDLMTETDKLNVKFILEYQQRHKGIEVKRDSIRFMWAG